jgi:hypothetical protein
VFLVVASVAGLLFGLWSVQAAHQREQPAARGLAGVLLNLFALMVALGGGLGWHATVWPHL